jgi:hypothetical protein
MSPKHSLSESLLELNTDDDKLGSVENKISKSILPLLIIFIGVIVLSGLGLLGIVFFGETVLWISFMVFIPILVIGMIAGQVANIRDRNSINQTWQKFADSYGLRYEINKDTRRLFGNYRGYIVSVNTMNIGIRGIELQTYIMLLGLRVSQDTYIKLSPYDNLDKSRKWFGQQDRSVKGELEQRFKVIAQPEYLASLISSSTELCQRLLKIELYRAKMEIADKVLYFQLSMPPATVENWRFLLDTLYALARTVEQAENQPTGQRAT